MEESSGQWDGPIHTGSGSGAFRRKMREVQIKQRKKTSIF